jgi:hypothetical protein
MFSEDNFGGANRGPASMRPRSKRSNIFVDLGFFVLLIGCFTVVGYQYAPLLTTPGYNVAAGHISRLDFGGGGHYSSRRRYFDFVQVDYSYKVDKKTYRNSVTSVPLLELVSLVVIGLESETEKTGLAVRYDPADPQKSVPVEVIDCFTKAAMATYVCVGVVGTLLLVFAGLTNLSGEKLKSHRHDGIY